MADSDKDILITPNTGVATTHPKMTFTGKDNSPIDLKILDDNTLSFEGVQGQVFSISPILNSGDIFSVNDISGVQSMAVNADGTISLNPTNSKRVEINGAINVMSDGTAGTAIHFGGNASTYIYISTSGSDMTIRADDDLFLRADDDLFLQAGGATKVTVLDSGNVGIGNTSPSKELYVTGDIGLTGDMYLESAKAIYFDSTDTFVKTNTDNPEDLLLGADQDIFIRPDNDVIFEVGTTEYVRFDGSTQRVGIGTATPSTALHVKGSGVQKITVESTDNEAALELSSDSTGPWIINSGNGSNDLRWYGNGGVRMLLESDGTLNINDAYKLPNADGTVDEILKTDGADVVRFSSKFNGYAQFFFQGDNVSNTANYNFAVLGANASSSNINSYGMPVAGVVKAITIRNAGGGTITSSTNGATFAVRINGASSGDGYATVVLNGDNMQRAFGSGSAYSVATLDFNQAFAAGDAVQVRRVSGDITFEEVLITLWVDFT